MRLWLAMMLGLTMVFAPATAQQPPPEQIRAITSLQAGDYLLRSYIQSLKHTLSPLASLEIGSRPQAVSVSRTGDAIALMEVFNWHEGCSLLTVTMAAPTALHYGDCDRPHDLSVQTPSGLVLNGKPYDFVGNAEHAIAAIVLGGVYTDAEGRRYTFGPDGQATFPGKSFPFELGIDQVVPPDSRYDSFRDKTNNGSIVFRRRGDSLVLYRAPANDFGPLDDTHPLVTLHRIAGQ
jgi:hypothetical protein